MQESCLIVKQNENIINKLKSSIDGKKNNKTSPQVLLKTKKSTDHFNKGYYSKRVVIK